MTITAKNIGRINVWPTYRIAREADTEESKFTGQLTVWQTNEEALANTSHEEEGGGGAPDWVPANAAIHIDLVGGTPQGRAWVAGTGEVAVDTLLGSDPNTVDGWGNCTYDPADLATDGLLTGNDVAFIGACRAALISGATFVYRFKGQQTDPGGSTYMEYLSADGEAGLEVITQIPGGGGNGSISSWNGTASAATAAVINMTAGAINVVAATITPTRGDIALNGSAAATTPLTTDDFPTSGASPIVAVLMEITGSPTNGWYWQSFTLYDPLPSTAGLSDLSEV